MSTDEEVKVYGGFVVIMPHYWGWGTTITEAKAQVKKSGGRLGRNYAVYLIPDTTQWCGVDGYGRMTYIQAEKDFPDGGGPRLVEDVKPKGRQ